MARQLTIESLSNESISYIKQRTSSFAIPVGLMIAFSIILEMTGSGLNSKIVEVNPHTNLNFAIGDISFLVFNSLNAVVYIFCINYIIRDVFDIKYFKKDMTTRERALVSFFKIPRVILMSIIYVFVTSLGLAFLIIPGFFALWAFYYSISLSLVTNDSYLDCFKKSHQLMMANKGFSFVVVFLVIILAIVSGGFSGLLSAVFGSVGNVLASIVMAAFNVIFTVVTSMGLIYMIDKMENAPALEEAPESV